MENYFVENSKGETKTFYDDYGTAHNYAKNNKGKLFRDQYNGYKTPFVTLADYRDYKYPGNYENIEKITIRNIRCGNGLVTEIISNFPKTVEDIQKWLSHNAFCFIPPERLGITVAYKDEAFVRDFIIQSKN